MDPKRWFASESRPLRDGGPDRGPSWCARSPGSRPYHRFGFMSPFIDGGDASLSA